MGCIVCESSDIRLPVRSAEGASSIGALDFGSTRKEVWRPSIAVCRSCGLGWQSPAPPADAIERAYAGMRDEAYVAEADNRRKASVRAAQRIEKYRKGASGRLLDVGCSAGFFLDAARDSGWDVWGVEPSSWLSDIARQRFGDRVLTGTLEAAPFECGTFDAVTMWDVLEHVSAPPAFLERAATLLKPRGIVALNVPCRDTAIAGLLGSKWPLLLPEHLYYFSRSALRILLAKAGFELLCFSAHPVFFSASYVAQRLAQHGWPSAKVPHWLERVSVPLLMGERTVLARRS